MNAPTAPYTLAALAFLALCHGLKEHTGKLLFHSADNDPRDNAMTLIEVQRFFLLFDLNGDGDIKANEFVFAWKQHFQLTEREAQALLTLVDTLAPKGEITEIEITAVYNKMDAKNTGSVTLQQFLKFWKDLGAEINASPDNNKRGAKMYRPDKFRRVLQRANENLDVERKMYRPSMHRRLI